MLKKTIQRAAVIISILAFIAVPALASISPESGFETRYDVPRLLGMEGGEENEAVRLDGPLSNGTSGPIFEVHGKAVSFDRDLRDLPQTGPKVKRPAREMGTPPNMGPNGNGIDTALQGPDTLSAPAPAPLKSFAGLGLTPYGAGWPPDTHGDVGPNYYIQVVNTSIGVFDKANGNRLAAFTFNSFFLDNGINSNDPCASLNYGDPIALYDQVSGRWIITDFAFAGSGHTAPYYECIAVSKSADPVGGGWWLYTIVADTQSLNDYPKLGIWSDGIYMSANMFKHGSSYYGVKVWALNRDDLIKGDALRSVAYTLGSTYFSLLPANLKGVNPPAGTPEYFMSDSGSNSSMKLWKFHVDWTTDPPTSTFTGPTSFAVTSFTRPSQNSVPQKNSTELLDTIGDRLMTWLQYRNIGGTESLWVSRTVVSGNTYGIRWMEVRGMSGTPSVYQQGTYAPDSNYRWMPSLAVNQDGDMAVGYSVSSSSMFPAIRYAGRLASDPLNTLSQTEASLIEGTGSQSGGYNRWGDYSSMSVDPVDDCTFWYTTEYYVTTGTNWQTRIGSFKLADCSGTPPDNPPTVTITNPADGSTVSSSVNVTADASDDHGVSQVEFFVDGNSIGVDTVPPFSEAWDTTAYGNGSHTVSATATDTINQTGSDSISVTVQNTATCYNLTTEVNPAGGGGNPTASLLKSTSCTTNGQYVAGELIDLTAHPDAGYHVAAWTGTDDDLSTASTNTLTMPASNHTVSVAYAQDEYTLTITSANGTVTKSPDQTSYHLGDVVQLNATADPGWTFSNWTGDVSSSTNPLDVAITGDMSLTANYTQNQFTLTITSAHGTVTKNPDQASYHLNDVVQLNATADPGWTFSNWSGDVSSSTNPLDVAITGNMSLTANYVNSSAPFVSSITLAGPSHTSADNVDFIVTFSEAVTGVDTSDFSITKTGSITGYFITTVDPDTNANPELATDTYTVTLSTGKYNGTLRLDVNASGTGIKDLDGNDLSGGYTSGDTYTVTKTYTLRRKSQPKYDGWVLESGEFTGVGGTMNHLGTILQVGDNAQDKQYRDILSFGTAALPDNAVITKVILKVKKAGVTGTNPMQTHNGLVVDIKRNKFYTLPDLQIDDFQAKPNIFKVGKFPNKLYSGWYRSVLNSAAFPYVNLKGRTQLRLRFLLGDNDNNSADILKLYSGNAVLADRPRLIIQYYVP